MSEQSGGIVVLRSWHVVILLVIQLLGIGIAYGRLTQQIDDMNRRLESIENNRLIGRDEFNTWREEMNSNIDRLEREVLERNSVDKLR